MNYQKQQQQIEDVFNETVEQAREEGVGKGIRLGVDAASIHTANVIARGIMASATDAFREGDLADAIILSRVSTAIKTAYDLDE